MPDPGDPAPNFEVETTAGETIRLSETLDHGPTVVVVFRGPWCSFCAEQLQTFGELSYDLWRNHDVTVLPVTGTETPPLVEMRDRFDLGIQLCSDPELSVARAYTGVEENRRHGAIPIPGTFVVDADGTVQYAQVAERPDDRVYAASVRKFVTSGFEDPYPGTYPDPYEG